MSLFTYYLFSAFRLYQTGSSLYSSIFSRADEINCLVCNRVNGETNGKQNPNFDCTIVSSGKDPFMMIARNKLLNNRKRIVCLYFSTELPVEEQFERLLSYYQSIKCDKVSVAFYVAKNYMDFIYSNWFFVSYESDWEYKKLYGASKVIINRWFRNKI